MVRQWYAGSILIEAFMGAAFAVAFIAMLPIAMKRGWEIGDIVLLSIPLFLAIGLFSYSYKCGSKEFFLRSYFPIRFNRRVG